MAGWFTSSRGALALSVIGLLAFAAYAVLVSRYVLEELTPGVKMAAVETLVVLAILGVWVWGLLRASAGLPGGWTILLVCSLLPTLFTLYDLVFQSPVPYGWPLVQIAVWVGFVCCALASAAAVVQLTGR